MRKSQQRKCKYDWKKIQKFYDKGNSYRDLHLEFGVSFAAVAEAVKRGDLVTRSISEALILRLKKFPLKLSTETKQKISVARKKYLTENPDKVPYLLNHYSKGESYPETYFRECFANSCFDIQFQFLSYTLDFADTNERIDIEIDGGQHRLDPRIAEHDIKRNATLVEKGWKIIRIYWPEFQKLTHDEKEKIVKSILNRTPVECQAVSLFGWG